MRRWRAAFTLTPTQPSPIEGEGQWLLQVHISVRLALFKCFALC